MPPERNRPRPQPGARGQRAQPARKPSQPRPADRAERPRLELSKPILQELHATARPGKGEILVKVFADAAAAYMEENYVEAIRLGEQAKHIALRSANAR